ncbi:hypothetical protein CC78DRAFT_152426 [Lojkania enalia]|uniref:Uncharacterized protein n=1 Tax=Lojkania enalia TaxID=147567 RepID=A0A9P4KEK4_9PLEO|nr:hypothetical protein CC78DRAFT_152426 [Didymosphaeria enalia]
MQRISEGPELCVNTRISQNGGLQDRAQVHTEQRQQVEQESLSPIPADSRLHRSRSGPTSLNASIARARSLSIRSASSGIRTPPTSPTPYDFPRPERPVSSASQRSPSWDDSTGPRLYHRRSPAVDLSASQRSLNTWNHPSQVPTRYRSINQGSQLFAEARAYANSPDQQRINAYTGPSYAHHESQEKLGAMGIARASRGSYEAQASTVPSMDYIASISQPDSLRTLELQPPRFDYRERMQQHNFHQLLLGNRYSPDPQRHPTFEGRSTTWDTMPQAQEPELESNMGEHRPMMWSDEEKCRSAEGDLSSIARVPSNQSDASRRRSQRRRPEEQLCANKASLNPLAAPEEQPKFPNIAVHQLLGPRVGGTSDPCLGPSGNASPTIPHTPPRRSRFVAFLTTCFSRPPSNSPLHVHDRDFLLKLEHDMAPSPWQLRILQLAIWTVILVFFILQPVTNHNRLAFDCYELKANLHLLLQNGTDIATNATLSDANFMPSDVIIPPAYIKDGRVNGSICLLHPLISEVVIFNSFKSRFIIGAMCVGAASLLKDLTFMIFAKIMNASGPYGTRTLFIRTATGVLTAIAGSALIMQSLTWLNAVSK